jgi:hypothetical protein
MVACGLLLAASKAEEYLTNPFFQLKMLLLLAVGLHGVYFGRQVYRREDSRVSPATARLAAVLSLVLWTGVVSMGRWIAYYDAPSPNERQAQQAESRAVVR